MEDINKIKEIINHPKLSDDYKFNTIKDIVFFKNYTDYVRSSNVEVVSYNDELKEMVIRFNNGETYTYYNVDMSLFDDIVDGKGKAITEGQNKYGRWNIGKSPSVGAAVYQKLVLTGKQYKKGGQLFR
jgi:hypothetical protein